MKTQNITTVEKVTKQIKKMWKESCIAADATQHDKKRQLEYAHASARRGALATALHLLNDLGAPWEVPEDDDCPICTIARGNENTFAGIKANYCLKCGKRLGD